MPNRPSLDQLAADLAARRSATEPKLADPGRTSLIAALYIVGASQPQLAMLYGVKRETIKSILNRKITTKMRAMARPHRLHKPLITYEEVEALRNTFLANRLELVQLDPVTMAARLIQIRMRES